MKILIILTSCFLAMLTMLTNLPAQSQPDIMSGVLKIITPDNVREIDYYVPPGMEKCYESLANGQGSCPDSGGEYVIMAGLLTCLYHSPRAADNDNLLLGRLTSEGWIISAYSDVLPVELFSLNVPIHLDLLPLGGPSQNCVTCDGPQEGTPCSNIPGCRWVKKIGEQERWVDKGVKCADRSDRCPGYNPSAQHICNRKARLWCLEAKLCCADPPLNCGDPSGLCPNREKDEWLMKHLEAVVPPKACNDQPCLTTNPVTVPVID